MVYSEGEERDLEKGEAPPQNLTHSSDPSLPSISTATSGPALVLSNSSNALCASASNKSLVISASSKALSASSSNKALVLSNSGKALILSNSSKSLASNSGKRIDQAGKKKYVKQVTGRHNDTELHLAAGRGDLEAVKQILGEIDAQMTGTLSGADFDAEVAEIRAAVVDEVNELGETALFTAAEKGHLDVVNELLKYSTKEGVATKNQSGLDALHIAASKGHQGKHKLDCLHSSNLIFVLSLLSSCTLYGYTGFSNGRNESELFHPS